MSLLNPTREAGAYRGGRRQGSQHRPASNQNIWSGAEFTHADRKSQADNLVKGRHGQQPEDQPPKGAGPRFKG